MKKSIPISIILAIWTHMLWAGNSYPNIGFGRLSVNDGLAHININTIMEDSEGYIWIGTFDGLSKYDGYKFTNYFHDDDNPESICSNFVTKIIEDQYGFLWVATTNGVSRFNKKTEKFSSLFKDEQKSSSLSSNSVWSLLEDRKGNIWMGTFGNGLNKIANVNKFPDVVVTHFSHDPNDSNSIFQDWVLDLHEDAQGNIWIASTGEYISRYDPKTERFDRIKLEDGKGIINENTWAIEEDGEHNLWLGTESGLTRLNLLSMQVKNYQYSPMDSSSIREGHVRSVLFDSEDNLWVGSQNGLSLYDKSNDIFLHLLHDEFDDKSVSSDESWSMFESRDGTIWIGTYAGGVNYYHPSYSYFEHIIHNPLNPNGLHGSNVTSFYEDDKTGNIWIALDHSGIDYHDVTQNTYTPFRTETEYKEKTASNSVISLFKDSKGIFWAGTYDDGLNKYDSAQNTFKKYPTKFVNAGIQEIEGIWTIKEDEESNLWIGTVGGGLNKYERTTDQFINFGWNVDDSTALSDSRIWSIWIDGDQVFLGTSYGLNIMNTTTGMVIRYLHDLNDSQSLSSNRVLTIYRDGNQRLWLGTQGGGLNLFEEDTKTFRSFQESDGLASNNVTGILEDDHGNLWLSTSKGISKFYPEFWEIRNFYMGSNKNQFNLESCLKLSNGKMLFGGVNGYHVFHPDSIGEIKQSERVEITDFQVFNKPALMSSLEIRSEDSIQTIKLDYQQSVFGFEFSALNYIDPEKVTYAYKLDNFEKDWIQTSSDRRFVTYTNIPPGEYLLSVKATDVEGNWSDKITYLRVKIKPPWWNTWWFKVSFFIGLISLIYLMYKIRMRIIYNQKRALEEEVKVRTIEVVRQKEELEQQAKMLKVYNNDILSKNALLENLNRQKDGMIGIVAHDLRSPLNNIKGLTDLVNKAGGLNEQQKSYIKLIEKLIHQGGMLISDLLYVNGMKQFDIKINVEEFDLKNYIDSWTNNYQNDLDKKKQKLVLDLQKSDYSIATDQDVLTRVLDNILTNAMKFSEQGASIFISLQYTGNWANISIRDEGPGISEGDQEKMFEMFQKLSAQPTAGESSHGLGLSIVKALVEKLKGQIAVDSQLGEGTEFMVQLPLVQELY